MKKGNKIRIIFWSIIATIALVSGVFGFASFSKGYGKIGKVVYRTKPVVQKFNSLNSLEKYINAGMTIEAKTDGKDIKVYYNTSTTNTSFIFTYNEILSDVNVLEIRYNKNDGQSAELITKLLIEAVSINYGYKEGDVFNKYQYEDFLKTKIHDGIQIIDNENEILRTVYINIDKSILDSNVIVKSDEELEKEGKESFINDIKILNKAIINDNKQNAIYYLNGEQTCNNSQKLEVENMDIRYLIEVKDNKIIKLIVLNEKYATKFEKDINIDSLIIADVISKDTQLESYMTIDSSLLSYCK